MDGETTSVDEILAVYDDNGNHIKFEEIVEEDNEATVTKDELEKLLERWDESVEEPISDRELSKIMEVYDDNINNKEGRNRSRINHRSKGRKKHKSDEVEITIIQTNCYGYTSKKETFDDIVKENAPDIVVIQ